MNHDELNALIELPVFIRMTSLEPKEGYAPSWRFDDCWEESDDMFRTRIQNELAKRRSAIDT
jgi:hypothetical protein